GCKIPNLSGERTPRVRVMPAQITGIQKLRSRDMAILSEPRCFDAALVRPEKCDQADMGPSQTGQWLSYPSDDRVTADSARAGSMATTARSSARKSDARALPKADSNWACASVHPLNATRSRFWPALVRRISLLRRSAAPGLIP